MQIVLHKEKLVFRYSENFVEMYICGDRKVFSVKE